MKVSASPRTGVTFHSPFSLSLCAPGPCSRIFRTRCGYFAPKGRHRLAGDVSHRNPFQKTTAPRRGAVTLGARNSAAPAGADHFLGGVFRWLTPPANLRCPSGAHPQLSCFSRIREHYLVWGDPRRGFSTLTSTLNERRYYGPAQDDQAGNPAAGQVPGANRYPPWADFA